MRTVKVALGDRSHAIHLGSALLPRLGAICSRLKLGQRCAVISDRNVAAHYGRGVAQALSAAGFQPVHITLHAGESVKTLRTVAECYDQLAAHRLGRDSFIVALGGGVIGDLAGFVAATYLRGIDFVQIPTTLLAQVDSSVGGKTGVNLLAGKNLVGAFHQPRVVLCDFDTLATLPSREFRAGVAEVIKYGIIYDAALFRDLENHLSQLIAREPKQLTAVVARCCEIKAKIVSEDETETGLRSILNFGHTIGHAIETTSGYGQFLHGEAIAIGQVAAAKISAAMVGLPEEDVARIANLFALAGLPNAIKLTSKQKTRLMAAMRLDKKVRDGQIKFVLTPKIGKARQGEAVPQAVVDAALSPVPS